VRVSATGASLVVVEGAGRLVEEERFIDEERFVEEESFIEEERFLEEERLGATMGVMINFHDDFRIRDYVHKGAQVEQESLQDK